MTQSRCKFDSWVKGQSWSYSTNEPYMWKKTIFFSISLNHFERTRHVGAWTGTQEGSDIQKIGFEALCRLNYLQDEQEGRDAANLHINQTLCLSHQFLEKAANDPPLYFILFLLNAALTSDDCVRTFKFDKTRGPQWQKRVCSMSFLSI